MKWCGVSFVGSARGVWHPTRICVGWCTMHTCAVNAVVATALPLRVSLRMSPRAHLSKEPLTCTPTTSPHCATDRGVWCIWMLSTCKQASRK